MRNIINYITWEPNVLSITFTIEALLYCEAENDISFRHTQGTCNFIFTYILFNYCMCDSIPHWFNQDNSKCMVRIIGFPLNCSSPQVHFSICEHGHAVCGSFLPLSLLRSCSSPHQSTLHRFDPTALTHGFIFFFHNHLHTKQWKSLRANISWSVDCQWTPCGCERRLQ